MPCSQQIKNKKSLRKIRDVNTKTRTHCHCIEVHSNGLLHQNIQLQRLFMCICIQSYKKTDFRIEHVLTDNRYKSRKTLTKLTARLPYISFEEF